jgi:hypothetical protein
MRALCIAMTFRFGVLILGLVSSLAACAAPNTSRQTTIIARRRAAPFELPEPLADRAIAVVEVQGNEVVLRVDLERSCSRGFVEEQIVRETAARTHFSTAAVLGLTGGALATSVAVYGQACRSHDPEKGTDEPCLGPFYGVGLVAGLGLAIVGLTVAGVQEARSKPTTTTYVRSVPVRTEEHAVCWRSSAVGSLVELDLDSGQQRLSGRIQDNGDARIAIPAEYWSANHGEIECTILLDGKRVRRASLRRQGGE